jgi:heptaprenyl diphosphate synthase
MKSIDRFRQKRSEIYQNFFQSRDLCVAGIIMMPAFLFNPSTETRIVQFLLFWFLAWLSGKKNNPLITLMIIAGIVLFNLIVPYGEELFRFGRFRVTEGALWSGIHRAVTLEGLIMLSKFSIRRDLKLPGTFGALIGESFKMLEKINERKNLINRKNIIGGIDQLMIELSNDDETISLEESSSVLKPSLQKSILGIIILIIICALIWSFLFFPVKNIFFSYLL